MGDVDEEAVDELVNAEGEMESLGLSVLERVDDAEMELLSDRERVQLFVGLVALAVLGDGEGVAADSDSVLVIVAELDGELDCERVAPLAVGLAVLVVEIDIEFVPERDDDRETDDEVVAERLVVIEGDSLKVPRDLVALIDGVRLTERPLIVEDTVNERDSLSDTDRDVVNVAEVEMDPVTDIERLVVKLWLSEVVEVSEVDIDVEPLGLVVWLIEVVPDREKERLMLSELVVLSLKDGDRENDFVGVGGGVIVPLRLPVILAVVVNVVDPVCDHVSELVNVKVSLTVGDTVGDTVTESVELRVG